MNKRSEIFFVPQAWLVTLLSVIALAACNIHKIDIQQGNIVTQEIYAQLKPGMKKKQVTFLVGTPLLQNLFNPNEWEYIYTIEDEHGKSERKRLTLYFKDDELQRIVGEAVLKEKEQSVQNSPEEELPILRSQE